jgi:hypothetical protein
VVEVKSKTRLFVITVVLLALLIPLSVAFAQNYSFSVPFERVDLYWETNGSLTIEYEIVFQNSGDPLDVVDLGLPNENYSTSNIAATINGQPVDYMDYQSPYIDIGPAIYFSSHAIPAGQSGTFRARITNITEVLYTDNEDETYASAVFIPNYFGSEFAFGNSDITVVYHLPSGVQPAEPKWHNADHPGFPETPSTGTDSQGRITYTWRNPNGSPSAEYLFGASFPKKYVTITDFQQQSAWDLFWAALGISAEAAIPLLFCCCFALFIGGLVWIGVVSDRKRRMQYLPPKISIEGHGIKRGLTAPEAGILLEQPMDKVLTMILFSAIKKGAAQVAKPDPLEVTVKSPMPADLREYETQFLTAFKEGDTPARRRAMQTMMVDLVKSVANKMRGFSKRETVDYYRKISEEAWQQVEAAGTPKVQSKLFDENLEWTMLDPNYDRRTTTVFTGHPVYTPVWWGRYAGSGVGGGRSVISAPSRSTGGGRVSLPTLPGADFAASVVGGVQNFAKSVTGNVADFTGGVTKVTNPPPPPVRSSGGGGFSGGGSSCACACAGCACACAGGGR